jgi:23S rRNA pseudouridine1911/1915/1917 synthase
MTTPETLVGEGSTVSIRMTAARAQAESKLEASAIVHADAQVVVVRKPSGIATVPYEDERGTLDRLVHTLLKRSVPRGTSVAPLGVVQRLDKETSGLLVFARTLSAKRHLQQQLRAHTVTRRYLAIAHGVVTTRTITSRLVQNRGDGFRGSTSHGELGRAAVTHVRALEALNGATLIECRLETGRTHQIRIHLSEAGHPLVGERVYQRRYRGPLLPAPRVLLHAAELGFIHPGSGAPVHFEDDPPADFVGVLRALRQRSK